MLWTCSWGREAQLRRPLKWFITAPALASGIIKSDDTSSIFVRLFASGTSSSGQEGVAAIVMDGKLKTAPLNRADPRDHPGITRRKAELAGHDGRKLAAEWFVHENATPTSPCILYVYGGTFLMNRGPMHDQLACEIARQLQGRVCVFDYRLAPEHPFPLGIGDVVSAYRALLREGIEPGLIGIFADGAGAALAVAALVLLRDAGDPLPAGLGLLCPWVDLTFSGGSYVRDIKPDEFATDFEILAELSLDYLQGADPYNPLASPVYAQLHQIPETLIHAAAGDPCCDDGKLLVSRLQDAGGRAHVHVWTALPWTLHQLHPISGQLAAVMASFSQFFRRLIRAGAKPNPVDQAALLDAYKTGVAPRIEPHMVERLDEIMRWAQEQGPSWIWPMIERRVERGALITQEEVEREWLFSMFDHTSFPMMIVSASRHVILANRLADVLLAAHRPLHIRNGVLAIADESGRIGGDAMLADAFEKLFAPLASGENVSARRIAFRLGEDEEEMHVQCFRLSPTREDTAAPPVVLVRLIPIKFQQHTDESLLRDMFGLSSREANLAAAFTGGMTLDEYCKQNDLTMPTVRTHFARIKTKLGARDQASVVRIVLSATRF